MKPIERNAIAMMPANSPGPTIETNNKAQMSELIEREETMISSAIGRTKVVLGVVLGAARNATGTAPAKPGVLRPLAVNYLDTGSSRRCGTPYSIQPRVAPLSEGFRIERLLFR